jgi:hypothetical protein
VQGVALLFNPKEGNFRGELSFHDGADTDNTNFQDDGENFGISARAEFAVNGNFKGYDDFSAMGNEEDVLVIGAGVNFTQTGDANTYFHTVDVQWEPTAVKGLGVYAAYLGQYVDGDGDDVYNWGLVGQAGFMVNDQLEPFVRAGWISFDDTISSDDDLLEFTVGANYYLKGHNAKVTIDLTYLPDGSPSAESGIGVLAGDDTQIIVRGQFQLWL